MNHEQRLTIKKNLDILLRRKRTIIVFLLLAIAGGTAYYLQLPKIYQSAALIRYQQQSVNPSVMSPDDTRTHTRDIVNTIRQQITSRTSLESLINEHDLYPSMREAPMERIVDMMRNHHIATRLLEGGDVFEVSYLGSDQQKVMDVTNALAQRFIQENLRFRQAQATQTSTYIRDELKMAKESLDEKEKVMRDYKLRYYNEMPEQLLNNTSRLNGLQEQHQNLQSSRLQLEQTRLLVQEQIAARIEIISQRLLTAAAAQTATPGATEGLGSTEQVRQRLQTLQTRYTDNHPEIRRLQRLLQTLESRKSDPERAEQEVLDPQIMELRQQLKDIEFNISRLRDERQNVEEQIKKYESWIAAAPIREAEWSALTRDYEQLNEHYQRLVTQSLQAESSQSLEKQLQGSQFKIVDMAHFPEKPLRPDYKKILLLAVGLGLGLGGAVSFGVELLGTSFKDPEDLEKYLGIPVVSALPSILTRKETIKKRILNSCITLMLFLLGMAILAAIYYFWQRGMIIL